MEKEVTKIEMSPREAAEFLGVPRRNILKLMRSGDLDFRRYNHENKILWIDLVLHRRKMKE